MSKTAVRRQRKKPAHHRPKKPPAPKPMSDRAVYGGLVIIGGFAIALGSLLTATAERLYWRELILAYLAIVAWFMIASVFQVYRGRHILHWKQSLAKLALRPIHYGTRDGKPLEAAHGQPAVRKALLWTIIVCLIVLGALSLIFYWPF